MAFELPPLPYDYAALEPHIDEQTMRIHHDKHHAAYVNNANAALEKWPEGQKMSVEEVLRSLDKAPEEVRGALRNNAGGHHNHAEFWVTMTPGGASAPTGDLAAAINDTFGGFDAFKDQFKKAGVGRFGSGWAWLIVDKAGKLAVTSTPNQDSPLMDGNTPILGVDVWEHAYYLKYQNRRPDYLDALFNVINWDIVGKRYAATKAGK